ncbi:MAG TPA: MbnP family protein [Saprospiraceae bacterium]|nr:MbnP family protein [Saprospiraceae bacterium]
MKLIPALLAIAGLMTLTITFNGCKDDDPVTKPGSLAFHIHTLIDANEVENYGEVLATEEGRQISVTTAQLYISNVKLIKTDGSVVDGPSSILLVKQGVEEYEIGDVPAGDYKTVRFDVGLPDAVNASVPNPSDLTLYNPSMWFGATPQPDGFVFLNFQGSVDTTDALTGLNLIPFDFRIGTNAHRVTITMPDENFSVVPDQQAVVHLEANYANILDLVDLNVAGNLNIRTPEENSWLWVSQLETSIGDMFEYE